jgi:hypothetical protein
MPWVKWDSLAMLKLLGGWGLKNIQKIPISLATKTRWRMIQLDNLWLKVVTQKYINTDSVVEWIRRSTHSFQNGSIRWKALVKSFPVISQGIFLGRPEKETPSGLVEIHGRETMVSISFLKF